jgi:hypothetical protein
MNTKGVFMNNNLSLLVSPLEITDIAKQEEILDALQALHIAALCGDEQAIRRARYTSRKVLMKYRPATYQETLYRPDNGDA